MPSPVQRRPSVFTLARANSLALRDEAGKPQSVMAFDKLARKGKWEEIMHILTNEEDEATLGAWLDQDTSTAKDDPTMETIDSCSERKPSQTTALHVLMRHRPTVEVTNMLCTKLEELKKISIPEDTVDRSGQTPLHIACCSGVDVAVIRRLLRGKAADLPATTRDSSGRTALHWACIVKVTSLFSKRKATDRILANVQALVAAYPHAKVIRDENNMTPLQLALQHKADERIVEALTPSRRQLFRAQSGYSCSDDELFCYDHTTPKSIEFGSDDEMSSLCSEKSDVWGSLFYDGYTHTASEDNAS